MPHNVDTELGSVFIQMDPGYFGESGWNFNNNWLKYAVQHIYNACEEPCSLVAIIGILQKGFKKMLLAVL